MTTNINNKTAEYFIPEMDAAFDINDWQSAQEISIEAARHYPDNGEIYRYAYILAPSKVTVSPSDPEEASWVKLERWQTLTPKQQEGFAPLCPDFVVELRSKSDNMEPLREKMREYMANGASLGWLIDRKNKKAERYRQTHDVEILDNPTTLSGEDVLLGFVLDLTDVW